MLRLPVLFLFLPYAVHPKASVFTKLGPALRAGVDNILETIQNKWYPHTAVALEYAKTRRRPVGVFPGFKAGASDYFFTAVWTSNIHRNIFKGRFPV